MAKQIATLIILLKFGFIYSNYLEAELNYQKPKLERNNIVNKGVWVRNKFQENLYEKSSLANFLFRPNSLDVDNLLQNNFDAFGENIVEDTPFVTSYVERSKRSPLYVRKRRPRKSVKKCSDRTDCKRSSENSIEDSTIIKSKIISDLKPASLFNDYPYEVAILLNNNKIQFDINDESFRNVDPEESPNKNGVSITKHNINELQDDTHGLMVNKEAKSFKNKISNLTDANNNTLPTLRVKYDYVSDINNIIDNRIPKGFNRTDRKNIDINQHIFDKNGMWYQTVPVADNIHNRKMDPGKSKAVTEKGLIKVISMLTRTFKKVMRQYSDIKNMHDNLHSMTEEFIKNITLMTSKFDDFNSKYSDLLKLNEKLRKFEANMNSKEGYFRNKEREMDKNFMEFESQQKKFLTQQRQFFNIQKLMLAQNEKINMKQNSIAKTQSEISHRQNNFARILKKAKQLYNDRKHPVISKAPNIVKIANKGETVKTLQTTTETTRTESVKINLFSIPVTNRLKNQDELIMKDKDEQPIDDLVYKYYFNNTFIDSLMKSKVLTSFSDSNNIETRNIKNKRNNLETTILLPVKSQLHGSKGQSNRAKRWITPDMKLTTRKNKHVKDKTIVHSKAGKLSKLNNTLLKEAIIENKKIGNSKGNPFLDMATNFCNQIGQNINKQVLSWCVEKALRRLQYIDMKLFSSSASNLNKTPAPENANQNHYKILPITTVPTINLVTSTNQATSITNEITPAYTEARVGIQEKIFFPDNEELEANLKQYELNPDTEGNVYYEGSLHVSDIVKTDSNGFSDIIPGLDSNSKVDMDPMAFDIHAKRRANVHRINDDILRHIRLG